MTSVRMGVSIRCIDIQHTDRTGLMSSLSAAELGDPEARGYKQCAALTQYLARTAAASLTHHTSCGIYANCPTTTRIATHA